jgi:hypothetical protein
MLSKVFNLRQNSNRNWSVELLIWAVVDVLCLLHKATHVCLKCAVWYHVFDSAFVTLPGTVGFSKRGSTDQCKTGWIEQVNQPQLIGRSEAEGGDIKRICFYGLGCVHFGQKKLFWTSKIRQIRTGWARRPRLGLFFAHSCVHVFMGSI